MVRDLSLFSFLTHAAVIDVSYNSVKDLRDSVDLDGGWQNRRLLLRQYGLEIPVLDLECILRNQKQNELSQISIRFWK